MISLISIATGSFIMCFAVLLQQRSIARGCGRTLISEPVMISKSVNILKLASERGTK